MNKPNIFAIATKELSQDAFIAWLLQWADEKYKNVDEGLYFVGQSFVRYLINTRFDVGDFEVRSVEAGRQWSNIDIWADINEKYFIIIEDKTETFEHDNQLERYERMVSEYYGSSRLLVPVYIKTGLEDNNIKKSIIEKGWSYCDRSSLLKFLLQYETSNDIYNDFVSCMKQKEEESNSFTWYEKLNSWEATKGLFIWLQSKLSEWTEWGYVPNQSGGFLGFWFHFVCCTANSDRQFYLQIENNCDNKCSLFIKLCGEWDHTTDYLYDKLSFIKQIENKYDLTSMKPSRYRPGEYTSVATIKDVFVNKEGKLDLDNLLTKIRKAMLLVDELAKNS